MFEVIESIEYEGQHSVSDLCHTFDQAEEEADKYTKLNRPIEGYEWKKVGKGKWKKRHGVELEVRERLVLKRPAKRARKGKK